MKLDLYQGPVALTEALVNIDSVSHHEDTIATKVHEALSELKESYPEAKMTVARRGNTVLAKTNFGYIERVLVAGHLDTVPTAHNVPATYITDDKTGEQFLCGCGTVDMKSGDAVFLHALAQGLKKKTLKKDVTAIFYEAEEVAATYNGLAHVAAEAPEWFDGADIAILGEPSGGGIEAGCQGSIRLRITGHGERAHSARSWLGRNAFHLLIPVMTRIAQYEAKKVAIDGLSYHEGLNITWAECGVATNTIPDRAWFFVNFRFAPNRSEKQALAHLLEVLDLPEDGSITYEIDDTCPGALPGLSQPAALALVRATGGQVGPKFGWTDVARFAALGIPAVNFGPGDPSLCHRPDERCPIKMIEDVAATLVTYLSNPASEIPNPCENH